MSICQICHSAFLPSTWYRRVSEHSVPSKLIFVDPNVIDYFEDDCFKLPHPNVASSRELPASDPRKPLLEQKELNPDLVPFSAPLPEFEMQLSSTIKEFKSCCFIKFNDTSCADAIWVMQNGEMRCRDFCDAITCIKSSDFVRDAVRQLSSYAMDQDCHLCPTRLNYEGEQQPIQRNVVFVRNYIDNMHPSLEFRCFVSAGTLVAMSQRKTADIFDSLQDQSFRNKLWSRVSEFASLITSKLDAHASTDGRSTFPFDEFVMDIYFATLKKPLVLDIAPFSPRTQPLLFSWNEIDELKSHLTKASPLSPLEDSFVNARFRIVSHVPNLANSADATGTPKTGPIPSNSGYREHATHGFPDDFFYLTQKFFAHEGSHLAAALEAKNEALGPATSTATFAANSKVSNASENDFCFPPSFAQATATTANEKNDTNSGSNKQLGWQEMLTALQAVGMFQNPYSDSDSD